MFYVGSKSGSLKKGDIALLKIFPVFFVFITLMSATVISWQYRVSYIAQDQQKKLHTKNSELAGKLTQNINYYDSIITGAAGLFAIKDPITRDDWRQYISKFNVPKNIPSAFAVGYMPIIEKSSEAQFLQLARQEIPEYQFLPTVTDSPMRTPILYVEPFTQSNRNLLGFDMYSQQIRRDALINARDKGETIISGALVLVQEAQTGSRNKGFLLVRPVYKLGVQPALQQDRVNAVQGYAYIVFRANMFLDKIVESSDNAYGFTIKDVATGEEFYTTQNYDAITKNSEHKSETAKVAISGSQWELEGVVSPNISAIPPTARPQFVLISGLIFSAIAAWVTYVLLAKRVSSIVDKEEQSIQLAKDELLSLASHQLRTPATGVKQYVGMLLEGYVGSLNKEQKLLLTKAYESNERQLGIINEMLFVARSDSGELKLQKTTFSVSSLIEDIILEQLTPMVEKKINLTKNLPSKPVDLHADKQYVRMALENILSNAVKYTDVGGKITISLKATRWFVKYTVEDNGVGVPKKEQAQLFKKFSRIPNEMTNQVSGSGIGLYLSKKVVEMHDGTIKFESDGKSGSTVTVALPRYRDVSKALFADKSK